MGISDEDWGEFKGMMKSHVKRTDEDRELHREFRTKMYAKLDELEDEDKRLDQKADKAHTRMDELRIQVRTAKGVTAVVAAVIAWLVGLFVK